MLEILNGRRGVCATASLSFVLPERVSVVRHVDKDPQHPAHRLAPELHVKNLQIVRAGHPLGNGANLVYELRKTTLKNKKWATGPLSGLAGSYEHLTLSQGAHHQVVLAGPHNFRLQKRAGPKRLQVGVRKIHNRVDFRRLTRQ